jgi:hypothetical protein
MTVTKFTAGYSCVVTKKEGKNIEGERKEYMKGND